MTNLVAIDPGKTGGIAMRLNGSVSATPLNAFTEKGLFTLLCDCRPATCYIEKVHSSPQQGVVSAFSFGEVFGVIRMAAIAANLRVVLVTPQRWQAALQLKRIGGGFGKNDKAKKNRNKQRAEELYPDSKITHAIADALLILEYARMIESSIPQPQRSV